MIDSLDKLKNERCFPVSKTTGLLNLSEVQSLQALLPTWEFCATEKQLCRTFHFNNYMQGVDFVNSVAKLAEAEDHHPDIQLGFKRCKISWETHSVNGLSRNDFICAAKVDELFDEL